MSTSGSGSNEEVGRSRAESPGDCKTPPELQHQWTCTQPAIPQLTELGARLGATESPQQTFAFDFDLDSGVWVSADPYLQLGNAFPKDMLDLFTYSFPEPLA